MYCIIYSLYRNKIFQHNKMFQQNASKFAIFFVKNLLRFFHFLFHVVLKSSFLLEHFIECKPLIYEVCAIPI